MENKEELILQGRLPKSIVSKIGYNLHKVSNNPICIMKNKIYKYFIENGLIKREDIYEDYSPIVSTTMNFDDLLIGPDHPARSKSDTYYIDKDRVLRTHTSAHQSELLRSGRNKFLVVGDVYRKDEIDRSHYPVFHQIEGVFKVPLTKKDSPVEYLKEILSGLVEYLYPGVEYCYEDDYFPFTEPSLEINVGFNGEKDKTKWMEILGCGVVHKDILMKTGRQNDGEFVAFGLGLERLAMIGFEIPDIRYLWSTHNRFIEQFAKGEVVKFKQYSKLPVLTKDISFWINPMDIEYDDSKGGPRHDRGVWKAENSFYQLARENLDVWVEKMECVDDFYNLKTELHSRLYRMTYSPVDPDIKDIAVFTKIVNEMQDKFREVIVDSDINVILR